MEKSSTVMARSSAATRKRLSNRQIPSLSASWKRPEEQRMNTRTQTVQERIARLIDVAAGRTPADVVIRNIHLVNVFDGHIEDCLLYTSPSPRDGLLSRMPSSA